MLTYAFVVNKTLVAGTDSWAALMVTNKLVAKFGVLCHIRGYRNHYIEFVILDDNVWQS